MIYFYKDKKINFLRYPRTTNKSLRAWNTADEYILNHLENEKLDKKQIAIYNDRFGFLSSMLHDYNPIIVNFHKSQERAIVRNLENNSINYENFQFLTPIEYPSKKSDIVVVKIPKTLNLFRYYLQHLTKNLKKNSTVICSFMTKHFSKQMLQIADEYFEDIAQSLAWKKSRLLILKKPKTYIERDLVENLVVDENLTLKQYPGVFSADHIDPATRFLLDTISIRVKDKVVLDLGCGNGILGRSVHEDNSKAELHLLDDYFLAVESAKLNISGKNVHFHYNDNLKIFDNNYFSLVISNPPFHFDHENNIEVSIDLFKHVARILSEKGRFVLVANQHLNYRTHLEKYFNQVEDLAENEKYIIYECKNISETETDLDEDDDSRFNI